MAGHHSSGPVFDPGTSYVAVPGGCWWPRPCYDCCPTAEALLDEEGKTQEQIEYDLKRLALIESAAAQFLHAVTGGCWPGVGCTQMIQPPIGCCRCPSCCCEPDWGKAEPILLTHDINADVVDVKLWVCGQEIQGPRLVGENGPVVDGNGDPMYAPAVTLKRTQFGVVAMRTEGMWPNGQNWSGDPREPHGCNDCCGCVWGVEFCVSTPAPPLLELAMAELVCEMIQDCDAHDNDCGCNKPIEPKKGQEVRAGGVTISKPSLAQYLNKSSDRIITHLDSVQQLLATLPPKNTRMESRLYTGNEAHPMDWVASNPGVISW